MKIIVAYSRNKRTKINAIGNTLSLMSLLVAISKLLAERISEEKKINIEDAEKIVIECVSDGMKSVNN